MKTTILVRSKAVGTVIIRATLVIFKNNKFWRPLVKLLKPTPTIYDFKKQELLFPFDKYKSQISKKSEIC